MKILATFLLSLFALGYACNAETCSKDVQAASTCSDVAPKVASYVQPELPSDLLKPGDSAQIIVRCAIDEKGDLVGTRTISSTHKKLEAIILKTLEKWEFQAATHDGKPQRATVDIPFSFVVATK